MSRVVVQRDGGEDLRWCGVLTLGFRNMVGDALAVPVRFYGFFLVFLATINTMQVTLLFQFLLRDLV